MARGGDADADRQIRESFRVGFSTQEAEKEIEMASRLTVMVVLLMMTTICRKWKEMDDVPLLELWAQPLVQSRS